MKQVVIVVDMINDFVGGKLGSKRAVAIVKPIERLIKNARLHHIPIIYTNDAHISKIDHELIL
jgi:nicotinamidase-related amidase